MNRSLWLVATVVLAFVAALGGVRIGRMIWPGEQPTGANIHRLLHESMDLDSAQSAKLEALETHYASRRKTLEAEMRADNARLATAIEAEHGYGPQVAAAVNASHAAMGTLQKETLAHVFAVRQLLRPDQAARFDAAVSGTLTDTRR